jgi:hypothetical protein
MGGVACDANPPTCDEDGVCDADAGETCGGCASDCGICADPCGPFTRAKCDLGVAGCDACPAIGGCGDGTCAYGEDDVSCSADCGCAYAGSCEQQAPRGCWCDEACRASDDCCADVAVCGV